MTYSEYIQKCLAVGREFDKIENEKKISWVDTPDEMRKHCNDYNAAIDKLAKEYWFGLQPGDGVAYNVGRDYSSCTVIGYDGDSIIVQEDLAIPTGKSPMRK